MSGYDILDGAALRGADLLLFRVGSERFAAPLATVAEAVDLDPASVQAIPGGPPAMRGVFTLRGALVPLYDVRRPLGVAAAGGTTALVVEAPGGRAAIAVDDVEDVVSVREEEVRDATDGADGDAVVRGVVHRGPIIIAIVDMFALVAACRASDAGEIS